MLWRLSLRPSGSQTRCMMGVLVTAAEMRAAEAAVIAGGRTEPELMRAAAAAVAAWIDIRVRPRIEQRRAVALIGPGNNGGDALVALAELTERGWSCAAIYVGREELG